MYQILIKILNYNSYLWKDNTKTGSTIHDPIEDDFWAISFDDTNCEFGVHIGGLTETYRSRLIVRFDQRMLEPENHYELVYDGETYNVDCKDHVENFTEFVFDVIGALLSRPEFIQLRQRIILKQML